MWRDGSILRRERGSEKPNPTPTRCYGKPQPDATSGKERDEGKRREREKKRRTGKEQPVLIRTPDKLKIIIIINKKNE